MGFRPWVIFVVVSFLVIPEVRSQSIQKMLEDFYYRISAYERASIYKAKTSSTIYAYDSFNYLQGLQHVDSPDADKLTDNAQMINTVSQILNFETRQDLPLNEKTLFGRYMKIHLDSVCSEPVDCQTLSEGFTTDNDDSTLDLNLYRSINGICNNWNNPLYGTAFTHQERLERGKFGGRGIWETVAAIPYDLSDADRAFSTERIGAIPEFNKNPYLVKVKGDEPLFVAVYDNKGKSTERATLMANAKIEVEGALFLVEYRGDASADGCEFEFQEGGNVIVQTAGTCNDEFRYKYYEYDFVIVFQPASSSADSGIYINGLENDPDTTWPDQKFAGDEFSRFWLNFPDDSTIQISQGTEFRQSEVFVKASVPAINLNRAALAIRGGNNRVEFVARDVLELVTNTPQTNLDTYGVKNDLRHVQSIYRYITAETFSVMRLGVSSDGPVTVNYHNQDGDVLRISLTFDPPSANVKFDQPGFTEGEIDAGNILDITFKTAAGDEIKNQRAFWFVAFDNGHVYFGSGNLVGRNLITVTPINIGNGLALDFVSVSSEQEAFWTFDLEQLNRPRTLSYSSADPLSSALDIAMKVHTNPSGTATIWSKQLTMACFQFGQFLDHDFVATPLDGVEGHHPICCDNFKVVENDSFSDIACFNIPINTDVLTAADLSPYDPSTQNCMSFSRSAHILDCSDPNADDRHRQQLNSITAYIDGSNVYGSTKAEIEGLRDHNDVALLEVISNGNPTTSELPIATVAGEACVIPTESNRGCRHAGDFRSQENSGLNSMHTLWVREHNRIVTKLREFDEIKNNPPNDYVLFEWARHILVAEMQVVVYKEYLPSFLSPATMDKFKLGFDTNCKYKNDVIGSFPNEGGIMYRMGHSWISEDLAGSLAENSPFGSEAISTLPLFTNFFDPAPSFDNGSNSIMFNWGKKCAATDRIMGETVNTKLFANLGEGTVGANLAALNVQRGRDHGSPTYNQLREILKLPTYSDIDELCDNQLDADSCAAIKAVYHSINDIDSFTAGMVEQPVADSHVGEILNEVLGTMFQLLKQGDRFWYTCYFNKKAYKELQKVRLGKIMCDNVEGYDATDTQLDLFKIVEPGNEAISCDQREEVDLSEFLVNGGRADDFESLITSKKETEDTLEELLELLEKIEDKI